MTIEHARAYVQSGIDGARAGIEEFKAKLDVNPFYAFEWAESAARSAAEFDAWSYIMGAFEAHDDKPEWTAEEIRERLEYVRKDWTNAIMGSRYIHHSTSTYSNAANLMKHEVIAKLLGDSYGGKFEYILDRLDREAPAKPEVA